MQHQKKKAPLVLHSVTVAAWCTFSPVFPVWYFISLRPSIFEIYIPLHDIFKANNVLLISWVTTWKWCWDLNLCLSLCTRMLPHTPNVTFRKIGASDTLIFYMQSFGWTNCSFFLLCVNTFKGHRNYNVLIWTHFFVWNQHFSFLLSKNK